MITNGNLIKLDKTDIETFRKQKLFVDKINQKLVVLRQKQIYSSLAQSTKIKIEMFDKVHSWVNLLEKRIFDPQTIKEMDINKAISLMKFVANVALKLLAQSNDTEQIFKTYVELQGKLSTTDQPQKPSTDNDEISNLKKGLYEILMESTKTGSEVVEPVKEAQIVDVKIDDEKVKKDELSDLGTEIPELKTETKKAENPDDSQLIIEP